MNNPFKKIQQNAKESKKEWNSEKDTAKISTRSCDCCGAPRPTNTNLTHCSYCQFQFMNTTETIKPDDNK